MQVQQYLRSGKTYEDLAAEFGIKSSLHPHLPLVILNYDQIESSKSEPIARECRSLTLDTRDHTVVGRSFSRFFNWGEMQDEMPLFDFTNFIVQTKEDGSLIKFFYFEGKWHLTTRGSFGLDELQGVGMTWIEAICRALGIEKIDNLEGVLDPKITYIGEFCSLWNKVVRQYQKPVVYLLTAFRGHDELTPSEVDALVVPGMFLRPERFHFTSIEGILDYLKKMETDDPTYEGVVICDSGFRRWKLKNLTYLSLHALKGEGSNMFLPKYIIPFVLAGEGAELITYFPEVEERFNQVKEMIDNAWKELVAVWQAHHQIEGQKEFALAIKGKTKFTNLLFTIRRNHGQEQKLEQLQAMWRDSYDHILKNLF